VSGLFSSLLLGHDDTPMLWLCPALEDISKGECLGRQLCIADKQNINYQVVCGSCTTVPRIGEASP
jgi:hypothetical protein